MTTINNDPPGKQILDKWATIIVRKNAVYLKDGEAGVNQKINEFYDPKKYNDDIVLWIPPKDCLRIEFEDTPEKNRRYLAEVEANLKSLGFDYCITAHEGCKSPYINVFNIKDMPLGEDNKLAKDCLLHKIIPKEALGYLDKTNIGWTLSPVIHHPHWKPKYKGAIHKIIRGKDPLEHQNNYPKALLKKIETSKKRYEQMATKKPMSETWTEDFLINYCTKNILPAGNRHFIIEKNLAALTVHRKDRDQIVERYLIQQNRKTNTLRTWFNSIVNTNQYTQVNADELAAYIKTNNIPYTIKTTPIPGIDITPENIPKTRDELYKRIQKWLYIPDTKRIDVLLSVAISTNRDGKPLWVFFVGGSGDAKSELVKPLEKLPFARKIDQLTANTLASGKKDVNDLGSELDGKKTLLLFSDLACLTSLNKDEKKKIWGQFRTLYDGEIFKDTGSGVQKKYENCHVNILACTTSSIKEEYHIHQQLGTRELLFDTDADPRDNKEKMRQALRNNGKQKIMRKEITEAMLGFLHDKVFDDEIELSEDIQEYLYNQCERMRVLRATGSTDWKTGELNDNIEAEVTTRLIQQFGILYQALYSMDKEYPIERFHDIIEKIVKSSSHPIRYLLYNYFEKSSDWVTAHDLHIELKISRLTIASQCEILWNFNLLKKKFQQEMIGYEGSNRWRDVAYYQANFQQQEKLPCSS